MLYTFLITSILSLFILAFKIVTNYKAVPTEIIHKDSVYVNIQSPFSASVRKGKSYEWDFGDGSKEYYSDSIAMHKYKSPGTYIVILTIDGEQKDVVKQQVFSVITSEEKEPEIRLDFPPYADMNKNIEFTVTGNGDSSKYAWYFEDSEQPYAVTKYVVKNFSKPGNKNILLIIDPKTSKEKKIRGVISIRPPEPLVAAVLPGAQIPGGGGNRGRVIDVSPKPVSPGLLPKQENEKAEEKQTKETQSEKTNLVVAPEISKAQFENMLFKIRKEDKPLQEFSSYVGGNFDLKVVMNKKQMTFRDMYDEIKGMSLRTGILKMGKKKKIYIDTFETDPKTHIIQSLVIRF